MFSGKYILPHTQSIYCNLALLITIENYNAKSRMFGGLTTSLVWLVPVLVSKFLIGAFLGLHEVQPD